MPIVVVGNEKNFAALRPRLFEDKVSAKVAAEVSEQVRRANPHTNLDKLTPGTVLTIPDDVNVRMPSELSLDEATTNELRGLGEHGKALLGEMVTAADQREAESRAERTRASEAIDSVGPSIKKRERGLSKELTAARKGLAEEDERAKQRTESLKQAQAEWTEGLDALTQLLG